MKQAIVTRKLPPTNNLGVRYNVKTIHENKMFTRGKDFSADLANDQQEHIVARLLFIQHLCEKHGTPSSFVGDYVCGVLPNGDVCHVTK
jgi:hypothetical protein